MTHQITIINTHTGSNPAFIDPLRKAIDQLNLPTQVLPGYSGDLPDENQTRAVLLTGVPFDVTYSLSQPRTQHEIDHHFGWLRTWKRPVLGICYGHQILAQVFEGEISSLPEAVIQERYSLTISPQLKKGIFAGLETIQVFAEHKDFVARVPENFIILSRKDDVPYVLYDPARDFYGFQFVPERSDQPTHEVLEKFLKLMPRYS